MHQLHLCLIHIDQHEGRVHANARTQATTHPEEGILAADIAGCRLSYTRDL